MELIISDMSRMFCGCYHLSSFSEINTQKNINDLNDILSEDNSYTSLKEEKESNDSYLIEDNISGLIADLHKEYIESSFLSSIHNYNNTTYFFSEIDNFQNNIEIPTLKGNNIFHLEKMFYDCSFINITTRYIKMEYFECYLYKGFCLINVIH